MNKETPYASFEFKGTTIDLDKNQFTEAVLKGSFCKCNKCLACKARDYYFEMQANTGEKNV